MVLRLTIVIVLGISTILFLKRNDRKSKIWMSAFDPYNDMLNKLYTLLNVYANIFKVF